MDEHHGSALHYGHVGRAVYLPDDQAWTFTRSLARAPPLQYTGVTETSVRSPFPPTKPDPIQRVPEKSPKNVLGNAYPELVSAWPTTRQEPLSRVVTETIEEFDPETSSLFDLGHATDKRPYGKKMPSVPIAAAVTGRSRNAITFRALEDTHVEVASPPHRSMMCVPAIGKTSTSKWSRCGAPIRQVHFARLIDDDPIYMAARLLRSTVIFQPLFHFDPVPIHFPTEGNTRPAGGQKNSRLDPNPVLDISVSRTGGFSHADVTFNPWYQQQFGLVDTRGRWSVWEITHGRRSKSGKTAAGVVKSGFLPVTNTVFKQGRPQLDGWASIEWIHEFGLIIVANRRNVMIYAFMDDQTPDRTVVVDMPKESEWVMDLKRNPRNPSQFFVLTTTRILWFDMASHGKNDSKLFLHPRVTWRHFRDPNDTTIKFSEIVLYKDLYLVVFSQMTELVQGFPCPFVSDEESNSISVTDPFILDTNLLMNIAPNGRNPVRFSTFVFREVAHTPTHLRTFRHLFDPDLVVIKLFWLDSDLAIHESVFYGPQGDPEEPDYYRDGNVLRLRKRYAHRKRVNAEEDFIVNDWDDSTMRQTRVRRCRTETGPTSADSDSQWSLDFSNIYAIAIGKKELPKRRSKTKKRPTPTPRTFDDLIAELQRQMYNPPRRKTTNKTIIELSEKPLVNAELDQSALEAKRLLSAIMPEDHDRDAQHRYILLSLPSYLSEYGMPIGLSGEVDQEMFRFYDKMVDDWVSPLHPKISVVARLNKEKLIRKIAADLLLSRVIKITNSLDSVILPPPEDPIKAENEQALSQHRVLPSSFFQSQTPASQFGSQRMPKLAPSKYSTVPVLGGLSAFTTFKKQRKMPGNVSNLLSQWPVGSDPSTYSWQRIEDEETRASQTPRRRKKRAKVDQTLPATPMVPIVRTWGTQPLPQVNPASSQVVPMTQFERGAFGTREKEKKKKKKKRAAGF